MKCLGCKKDKPKTDFGTTGNARALCSRCRSGRVVTTNKRGRSSGSGDGLGNAIGDFIEGFIDAITGN
ncbi:hypothetical protein SEA_TRIBUTE_147 [Streptomyces phage Tribute]|nr:hypothetical protein SEA_TEUTSCH_147 [Streptomyces phage Teutsch]QGH78318.1 hypothetical protein SEA_TRIBUTE_147 [Streptomyces phage Tribute]WDS51924.1 hypothetical protein SEA_PEPPERWOOD_147 [Streptomyces phage Pepperwood]WNN95489.1 hypothetical protein SEA_WATERMOORE_147 [Streptomyces phage Watermoore]